MGDRVPLLKRTTEKRVYRYALILTSLLQNLDGCWPRLFFLALPWSKAVVLFFSEGAGGGVPRLVRGARGGAAVAGGPHTWQLVRFWVASL